MSVRLRQIRISIGEGVRLTLYERARFGFDASWLGGTEVDPHRPAVVGEQVSFILFSLGFVAQRVRTQLASAWRAASESSWSGPLARTTTRWGRHRPMSKRPTTTPSASCS